MKALKLKYVEQCRLCPMLGVDHVPASGSPTAQVMFIGQSPGTQEVIQGQPFVGDCGDLLTYVLDEAELSREEVYITNTLKCHPPGNRPGHPDEIKMCRKTWLMDEFLQVRPKIAVLLGKDAFTSFGPPGKKFRHLAEFENAKFGCTFIASYHPGFYLRNATRMEEFIKLGTRLKELLHSKESQ